MKTSSQTSLLILGAVLAIVLPTSSAYADTVMLPELSSENVRGVNVFTTYQSDNRYTVNIQVQYQVDSALEIPDIITYFSLDGSQTFTIPVQEEFITANTPIIITGQDPDLTPEEQKRQDALQRIEEKKQQEEEQREAVLDETLDCVYGVWDDGTSTWQAPRETLKLEKTTYFKHLPSNYQEKQLELWTEECKGKDHYWATGHPYFLNKAIEEHFEVQRPLYLDETDSPLTVEVTEADLLAEAIRAENIPSYYDSPYQDFKGPIKTAPTEPRDQCQKVAWHIDEDEEVCPLIDYKQHDFTTSSPSQQEVIAKQIQCDLYMPQPGTANYHPDKIPNFLQHCPMIGFDDE